MQTMVRRSGRAIGAAMTVMMMALAGACANSGLGSVLGSVLGGQQGGGQVSGTIRGVDTRSQQLYIQDQNGQTVTLAYDANTQVVYQNRNYSVTSLENGDQVTARVQASNTGTNGSYYTDLVQVDQSVSTANGGAGTGSVQSIQGIVRQIDRTNGLFALDVGNGSTYTVSLPYNPSRDTVNRFQSMRSGDTVRFYGVVLNNTRIELRQFY